MADELICPSCEQPVDAPADPTQNLVVCPHCGNQFFTEIVDEEEPDEEAARAEFEAELNRERDLDGLRIRSLSADRRGLYRARTYYILGMGGCVFGIYLILNELVHGSFNRVGQLSMVMLAIGCAMGVPFFWKKIAELHEELRKPTLKDPDQPPDFEPLSDGSQTWKQLEEMNRPKDEE